MRLRLNAGKFIHNLLNMLFSKEYAATRSWPSPFSRSDKIKLPEKIVPWMENYYHEHCTTRYKKDIFFYKYVRFITVIH